VRYQVNKDALKSQVEVTDVGDIEAPNQTKPVSFVNNVNCEKPKKKIIFRRLVNDQRVEDTDFELPLTAIEGVKTSANTLIGYFVEDKLSLITTQIGKPLMLNAFTSFMCADSWGHISFARALIEVSAEKELKQEVVMASLIVDGTGFTKERIRMEYEWIPHFVLIAISLETHMSSALSVLPNLCKPTLMGSLLLLIERRMGRGRIRRDMWRLKLNKSKHKFAYRPKPNQPIGNKPSANDKLNVIKLETHFDTLRDQEAVFSENVVGESSSGNGDVGLFGDPNQTMRTSKGKLKKCIPI
nr:hypothetical protein [Tanacetum cinerariifolium]